MHINRWIEHMSDLRIFWFWHGENVSAAWLCIFVQSLTKKSICNSFPTWQSVDAISNCICFCICLYLCICIRCLYLYFCCSSKKQPRKLFAIVPPLGSLSTQPLMLKLLKETPPPTTRADQTLEIAKKLGCRNNRKKEIQISGQILWINCQIVECLHSRFAFAKPGPSSERERDHLKEMLYNLLHSFTTQCTVEKSFTTLCTVEKSSLVNSGEKKCEK